MAHPARVAAAALLALSVAACGSTVQITSTRTLGADGLGPAGSTSDGLAPAGGSAAGAGGTTTSSSGGGPSAVSPVQTTSVGPRASALSSGDAGSPGSGKGVAAKQPLRIGVIYTPGADKLFESAGFGALSTGDTKAEATAVVDWITSHGGFGGHPATLVPYAYDTSSGSAATSQQEACTAMAQDYHVSYVVTILADVEPLAACLIKKGIGLLDDETGFGDRALATYASVLGDPGELATGRLLTSLVDDLWQRGWLTATSKVGVLAQDSNDGHAAVDGALTSALRRHGLAVTRTAYINNTDSDGGASASSSAVLTFRSVGVDRVFPVMYSPLYFMKTATTQSYHPRYAMSSNFGPGALLESTGGDQMKGAAGIGWQPYLDIGKGTLPPPVSPRQTLCFDIMDKAGQQTTYASVKGFQTQVCNVLFYLQDLAAAEPSLPADLLTSGRRLLGASFVPTDTFRIDVSQRTAGVAGFRDVAFEDSCSCMQYVSGVKPIS